MRRKKKIDLTIIIGILCFSLSFASNTRDKHHQPERVMDVVGVKPGMIIGEVGAGSGYFTFKLAKRVRNLGHIYANDISRSSLRSLINRCDRDGITNIDTIVGEVENPLLPEGLDMVFIVNAFHDLADPVALLNNLADSLKPDAPVVIIDRDPAKLEYSTSHFLTREEVLQKIEESVFVLDRIETFLSQHNIYIIQVGNGDSI
jgi:ubiquinone/menaquinone biosynthesis C-methylase UbiE